MRGTLAIPVRFAPTIFLFGYSLFELYSASLCHSLVLVVFFSAYQVTIVLSVLER
jgi:hypothetical protein